MKPYSIVRAVMVDLFLVAVWMQAQTATNLVGASGGSSGAQFGSQAQTANTLLLGSETSVSYDSNALNTKQGTQDFITALYPHIGISIVQPRWQAMVTYIPGLSYSSANINSYDLLSQSFGATYSYRTSKRLTLNLRDSFSSSSNPFDSLRNSSALPQFGLLNTQTTLSWNLIPKTIEVAEAEVAYQFTARDSGFVRANYQYLNYQQLSGSSSQPPLSQQSNSGTMAVGMSRQLSTHSSTGFQFVSQILDYGPGAVRTTAETLGYFVQTSLTRGISVSGIIGPQYVSSNVTGLAGQLLPNNAGSAAAWSWMGGGTISWTGKRNGMMASLIRQIGTGTGVQGNVRQMIANLQLQHKIGKRSAASIFATYNVNDPLVAGQLGLVSANNYLSVGTQISRSITDRLTFGFTAWAVRQGGGSSGNPFYSGNHNRAGFSLSYQLTKPLRRG
jgi:hypothetical protein